MVTTKLKEIEAAKARLAALEQSIADEMKAELGQLPAKYGFATTKAFLKAVKAATGLNGKSARSNRNRRTRARITDAIRAQVKKLAEEGKTGAFIAAKVGISVPSVQNIKKTFGLVQRRKKNEST